MVEVSVPCDACKKPVRFGDDFCQVCGARVPDDLKDVLRMRLEASDSSYAAHSKAQRKARATIATLSVLFVLGGLVMFFVTQAQVDDTLGNLRSASATDLLAQPVAGAVTVGELRAALERQPSHVLGLNLFLAAVMLGLWFWSKRAVLPAIIAALGIYVSVIVGSAIYDPTTLASGLIMKMIVLAALVRGVQSTVAARQLENAR